MASSCCKIFDHLERANSQHKYNYKKYNRSIFEAFATTRLYTIEDGVRYEVKNNASGCVIEELHRLSLLSHRFVDVKTQDIDQHSGY